MRFLGHGILTRSSLATTKLEILMSLLVLLFSFNQPLELAAVEPIEPPAPDETFDGLQGALADLSMSVMLVGRPGSHKTTLLRDVARLSSVPEPEGYGLDQLCVYVDTSGEGAGIGGTPHPAIGHALRIEVGKPQWQAERIRIAIRNLTCRRLIVDEIGYNDDVELD